MAALKAVNKNVLLEALSDEELKSVQGQRSSIIITENRSDDQVGVGRPIAQASDIETVLSTDDLIFYPKGRASVLLINSKKVVVLPFEAILAIVKP